MRIFLRSVMDLLLCLIPVAASGQLPSISPARAVVHGVTLDLSRREVRRILGAPTHRSTPEYEDIIGDSVQTWTYPAGEFVFYGPKLSEINCRVVACITPDGVRVGDPGVKVTAVYGPDADTTSVIDRTIFYTIGESDCWMSFVIKKGLVAEIRMACDYS